MAIVMPIDNGQIPTTGSTEKEVTKSQAQASKDMFLQLLVAEMQYQDPLEPTDNSQYIQQLYSMSQTESILQVQEDVDKMNTKSLVGKYVTVTNKETGDVVEGKVESVVDSKDGAKVYIDGMAYEASNITAVHDATYYNSVIEADTFNNLLKQMPSVEDLRTSHKGDLTALVNCYNSLSKEAQNRIPAESVTKMTELVNKMNSLLAAENAANKEEETEEVPVESPKAESDAQANVPTESIEAEADVPAESIEAE